jgi:hypothetical protein
VEAADQAKGLFGTGFMARATSLAEEQYLVSKMMALEGVYRKATLVGSSGGSVWTMIGIPEKLAAMLKYAKEMKLPVICEEAVLGLNDIAKDRISSFVGIGKFKGRASPGQLQRFVKREGSGDMVVANAEAWSNLQQLLRDFGVPPPSAAAHACWNRTSIECALKIELAAAEVQLERNRELGAMFRFLIRNVPQFRQKNDVAIDIPEKDALECQVVTLHELNDIHQANFRFDKPQHASVLPALMKLGRPSTLFEHAFRTQLDVVSLLPVHILAFSHDVSMEAYRTTDCIAGTTAPCTYSR